MTKKEIDARYYQKNKERLKRRQLEYNHSPRGEEIRAKYIAEHREYYKEKYAIFYEKNKVKREEYRKEYRKNNPDRYLADNEKRRALGEGVKENFTHEERMFVRGFWGNKCAICGGTKKGSKRKLLPIDHWYPLSYGYPLVMGNAVLLCSEHNSKKSCKFPKEVYIRDVIDRVEAQILAQVSAWVERS